VFRLHQSRRPGFTLLEILVAIGVMLLLLTISVGAYFRYENSVRVGNTERLIKRLHEELTGGLRRITTTAQQQPVHPLASALVAGTTPAEQRAVKVVQLKLTQKWKFPKTYAELVASAAGPPGPDDHDAKAMLSRLDELNLSHTAGNARAEEGGCLYLIFLAHSSVHNADGFTSRELRDTDGDQVPEFVDAWGKPLRFYRSAYTTPSPAMWAQRSKEGFATGRTHDPDDPDNLLRTKLSAGAIANFADPVNGLGYDPTNVSNHFFGPFLIVSDGPDGIPDTADDIDSYRLKLSPTSQ
jgi:prepilin-type N-terminal cleavage/methylation domain-containing protein